MNKDEIQSALRGIQTELAPLVSKLIHEQAGLNVPPENVFSLVTFVVVSDDGKGDAVSSSATNMPEPMFVTSTRTLAETAGRLVARMQSGGGQ